MRASLAAASAVAFCSCPEGVTRRLLGLGLGLGMGIGIRLPEARCDRLQELLPVQVQMHEWMQVRVQAAAAAGPAAEASHAVRLGTCGGGCG